MVDYTLTTEHALLLGLAIYAVASTTSENLQFENSEVWEKALILAASAIMVLHDQSAWVNDFIVTNSDHWGQVLTAVFVLAGYFAVMKCVRQTASFFACNRAVVEQLLIPLVGIRSEATRDVG